MLCLAAVGCGLHPPPPLARVRPGPGFGKPPSVVLALPTECDESEGCNVGQLRAVDAAARMSLEFAGHRVVDSERVHRHARSRVETITQSSSGPDSRHVEITVPAWDDASFAEWIALLREMGIDGVLATRISMGPPNPIYGPETIEVRVELLRLHDRQLVWSSRCLVEMGTVENGRFRSIDQAIEVTTRCALEAPSTLGAS